MTREAGVLPAEVTTFVGRRQAMAEVRSALCASRLVTLTGFGGVGKSRLALRVAREVRRAFTDGVCLVELAKLKNPSLVGQALAAALELREQSPREPEEVLAEYLADKQLLIVLDNCEHVLEACRRLVTVLLPAAPDLRVLATSREPLGVLGERLWSVPPLSVPTFIPPGRHGTDQDPLEHDGPGRGESSRDGAPSGDASPHHEALMLFEDRATAVAPGFAVCPDNRDAVVRLCQRLDGIPLAIELAAVQVRVLSVEQILARLDRRYLLLTMQCRGAPPRHQTLRAAVEWSFDLCSEVEQALWARCSVFAGEFDMDAAEGVCAGDGLSPDDVFDGVGGLVNKSILGCEEHAHQARYRMLDTIRHFGRERLAATGERDALRRRHRDYYLRLAERSDAESCGPRQAHWMERLRAERANFWEALDYCLTTPGEARTGLRMGAALWFYWIGCGFVQDGRGWLDRALALDTEPSRERARVLWLTGWIAFLQGDNASSLVLTRECRDLAEQLDDQDELTYALQFLGEAELFAGNLTRAAPILEEALARHRARNTWTAPGLLIFGQQGEVLVLFEDHGDAVELLQECLAICASLGERWVRSWAQWNLAVTYWLAGDPAKAATVVRDSLREKRDLNDLLGIPSCLELIAWSAASKGDARLAAMFLGAAQKMWERIGRPLFGYTPLVDRRAQCWTRTRHALGAEAFDAALKKGAELPRDEVIARALAEKTSPPGTTAARPESALTLTKRERQVAGLVAEGMTNREVATTLVISQRTAETHVENILTKLGFTSRTQIVAWVAQQQRRP
ncbi:ATP-binding protein [Actinopolymorpha pittospori]